MFGELRKNGYAVFPHAFDRDSCEELKSACYEARDKFRQEVSLEQTKRAKEEGVIRCPMKYSRVFYKLMENPHIRQIVDEEMGKFSILHLQNAFILPPDNSGEIFQTTFHKDFPRYLSGFRASLNVFVAVTDFNSDNGALRVVPGSHQSPETRGSAYLERHSVPVHCPAGSLIVFDSTLYHAAGQNRTRTDRIGINHQFTPHWIKPQIDYVRALGEETVLGCTPEVQRLLGWHSRVPSSLSEYYRPESERVYRGGQG